MRPQYPLFLAAVLLAFGAAPGAAVQHQTSAALRPARLEETSCEACKGLVESAEDFLTDPKTEQHLSSLIVDALCTELPQQLRDTCVQEVPQLVAAAVSGIKQAVTPRELCSALGVCDSSLQLQGTVDCPICKMIVVTLIVKLKDPEARAKIESNIREACAQLAGPDAQAICEQHVDAVFASLDNLLNDIDPEGACEIFQFCDKASQAASVPESFSRLRGLYAELPSLTAVGDSECDNCKTIVSQAVAILQDPKTQIELIEYAREGCSLLQDYKEQCVQYVQMYGVMLINLAINYLQPDQVCTTLGYCTAQSA